MIDDCGRDARPWQALYYFSLAGTSMDETILLSKWRFHLHLHWIDGPIPSVLLSMINRQHDRLPKCRINDPTPYHPEVNVEHHLQHLPQIRNHGR